MAYSQMFIVCLMQMQKILLVSVLMVYVLPDSKFNSKHRSWPVIWEAGIVIEVPPWTQVMYLSSLFLHLNIDGSVPTRDNSNVIEGDIVDMGVRDRGLIASEHTETC
ncbi:uncharacterized protein C8Q71DRAFT_725808 [Rhodofomes roseus]|uniref:Uncharacterized protein n=1 Tax=Rhodofomes roseus TaxID=34475 RepID=A0ABQ8K7A8_9APHY|nr:uncharacterized protein C8Q71DRAFT_725808 [Rhodofomes roseus]KAH9833128.1 hypothetical protein C8Q71DRAFT_725808 [Rhodofomes roseus]